MQQQCNTRVHGSLAGHCDFESCLCHKENQLLSCGGAYYRLWHLPDVLAQGGLWVQPGGLWVQCTQHHLATCRHAFADRIGLIEWIHGLVSSRYRWVMRHVHGIHAVLGAYCLQHTAWRSASGSMTLRRGQGVLSSAGSGRVCCCFRARLLHAGL